MTTSKYEESIKELGSPDSNKRLKALRFIKNSVIGNKTKKELYIKLGIVQRLVDYLSLPEESPYTLKIQAATILGSIAYGKDDNVSAVITSGSIVPLLNTLSLPHDKHLIESLRQRRKLIEASTRALKAIFTASSSKSLRNACITEKHIRDLALILKVTSGFLIEESSVATTSEGLSFAMIAEFTAAIVSKCCDTDTQQLQLQEAGIVQPLVDILHSHCIKAQEAALDALSSLCHENRLLGDIIIQSKSSNTGQTTLSTMLDFAKGKCPAMRLIACTCLTNLYRTGVFTEPSNDIILIVLPALVKLLQEPTGDIQEKAPLVLADLIKDDEEMQKAAYDADAISKLAELLASVSSREIENHTCQLGIPGMGSTAKRKEKIQENSLIAIAAATLSKEECRTQAIEAKVLPHVISGLNSKQSGVRLAACQCAKSLSRSVSHLRTSFVDENVAPHLVKLLHDESQTVQAAACGALCNLVLHFSPMKKSLLEAGAIDKFVQYSKSNDSNLKINGIWAINNLLFKAELDEKKSVMEALSFDSLVDLLHDQNTTIQEQALEIVRNLVFGEQEDIDWVYEKMGKETLLDVIENKLQTMDTHEDGEEPVASSILVPTLYIIVNMCSNAEAPKMDLTSRDIIVRSAIELLSHEDDAVRVAAAWVLINWTWGDTNDQKEDLVNRCKRLKDLGVQDKLELLIDDDPCFDVRDRAKTAYTQLSEALG
ncbi:hypothetical protein G6F70_000240 [Rhizopus microsporus]|uniref:Uncharacterized protein n=1 Tax=Rhizopus azygosporus TaxID=86630 RepID=A0A367KDN7_RHIAZ|nr:hypothetical protein G6F71_001552 [Rhizopus microsporus]RCI00308.1 hypothetical protein CU097_015398 [Rhizopus azygosporus]KAG1204636.1 hypothetical protein G6F70_000240 [Rhizopus microsporus]KAG1216128.1 hypothetical protein G6F69_000319 [Rhizopus microsporus]KAG1238473.1 hypothetical protein G6F67_000364 [Rhizopus microsporus]